MFSTFIKSSGHTRSQWAERLGISRAYLSDLLNGNATPSLTLAVKIDRATDGVVPAASWVDPPGREDCVAQDKDRGAA